MKSVVPYENRFSAGAFQYFYDFCLVRPPEKPPTRHWLIAVALSWGIAFFEYLIQVPANRIGYGRFNLAQLKIMQEVITLSVFVPFAVFYMGSTLSWNYLWAGFCLAGAVFFIFR